MKTKTKIFIGLKILEGIGVCLVPLILYGLGWVVHKINHGVLLFDNPRWFDLIMSGFFNLFFLCATLLFVFFILGAIYFGFLKPIIEANWEWASSLEKKWRKLK